MRLAETISQSCDIVKTYIASAASCLEGLPPMGGSKTHRSRSSGKMVGVKPSREKARSGMQRSCQRHNICMNSTDDAIEKPERDLRETGENEISAPIVGERVMAKLM